MGEIIALVVIAWVVYLWFDLRKGKKTKEPILTTRDRLKNMQDFDLTELYCSYNLKYYLGYDEVRKKICIVNDSESEITPYVYSIKDIMEVEIIKNETSITKTSRGSQLGGAVVGTVLAGGIGTIIGGLSGSKKTKEIVNRFDLRILVNDLKKPIHNVSFLFESVQEANYEEAERWYAILRILIKQSEEITTTNN
jgi:hypothetical protein